MTQSELFEHTVKSQMQSFLDGKNVLIFSYGVTNAGKTHTIQGEVHHVLFMGLPLGSSAMY